MFCGLILGISGANMIASVLRAPVRVVYHLLLAISYFAQAAISDPLGLYIHLSFRKGPQLTYPLARMQHVIHSVLTMRVMLVRAY